MQLRQNLRIPSQSRSSASDAGSRAGRMIPISSGTTSRTGWIACSRLRRVVGIRMCTSHASRARRARSTPGGRVYRRLRRVRPALLRDFPARGRAYGPQQRKLLEVAWEAMEDGGVRPSTLSGRPVGVFVGGFTVDYKILQFTNPNFDSIAAHTATGVMMTMLSNRLSYIYNLKGPSLTIDTACSSSLVAVDLACKSLQQGDTEMAFAGGALLLFAPQYTVSDDARRIPVPDGQLTRIRRNRKRLCALRGCRSVTPEETAGRRGRRGQHTCGHPRHCGQSGRAHQRHHGAESRLAAGVDATGLPARGRGAVQSAIHRNARHRDTGRRSARGAIRRSSGDPRAGTPRQSLYRFRQDQHWSYRICSRYRRPDQDGAGTETPSDPSTPALQRT